MMIATATKYKIIGNILFVSVDKVSSAKAQVEFSAEEEPIVVEIETDNEREGLLLIWY